MIDIRKGAKISTRLTGCLAALTVVAGIAGGAAAQVNKPAGAVQEHALTKGVSPSDSDSTGKIVIRDGLRIEMSLATEADSAVMEATAANINFTITDAATGDPVSGLFPAAWIDLARPIGVDISGRDEITCKDRASLYLQGLVGMRPLIDLNSYFVLAMNNDATISVIDPVIGVAGITQLYTQINLKRPGGDWTKTTDQKVMYVTMPRADQVAIVNLDNFSVKGYAKAGRDPLRVRLQADQKYLWVGNNSRKAEDSGVTVIDTETTETVAFIQTGTGHHEIATSDDNRWTVVTNRESGTATIIDVSAMKKAADIPVGAAPISVDFSPLSKAFYIADGRSGIVTVIAAGSLEATAKVQLQPGLGPMRVTPDGRFGLVVNTSENKLHVIDTATNTLFRDISVGKRPYQIAFTRAFVYIRSLDSERIALIDLTHIATQEDLPIVTVAIGAKSPNEVPNLSIAEAMVEAPGEAAIMAVSPADATVYYYMEGMNAPMGNFRNYGHQPVAVQVADRTLKETGKGVYSSPIRIPAAGGFDVAFLLDSPRILGCFAFDAAINPMVSPDAIGLQVQSVDDQLRHPVNPEHKYRFRLVDQRTGASQRGLTDVSVLYYRAPGFDRATTTATEVEPGVYEAVLNLSHKGAWYVNVGVPSMRHDMGEISFVTLIATDPAPGAKTGG